MKKIVIAVTLSVLCLYAQGNKFTYSNIVGEWEISPIRGTTIAFGTEYANDTYFTIDFDRRGEASVHQTQKKYYYLIKNGNLLISEYPPTRKERFRTPTDVMEIVGTFQGCQRVKYAKKGIAGVSSRNSFKACKIKREPVYVRPYE